MGLELRATDGKPVVGLRFKIKSSDGSKYCIYKLVLFC